jgi:ABC-2 type transport system ATP-binding protein
MLEIEQVTRRFSDFIAVDNLSLSVPTGSIFGFLGPNGAGKTTTMKMVCGIIRPTQGTIRVGGRDVLKEPLAVKAQIGYVPDRPHIYERLTAVEYMYFIAGLYSLAKEEGQVRTQELLTLFGLERVRDHLVESYSHGMKQRLVMASVLLHKPKLLIVDEPMVGLDPQGARLLKDILRQYTAEYGLTVLLSTHTLDVADEVCDQVAVINHGRLIAQGTPTELRRQTGTEGQRLEEVFLQLTAEVGS